MNKRAFLGTAATVLGLGAAHRGADALGAFLLRRGPLAKWTNSYYSSMSRAGLKAGLDPTKNVMPGTRKMLGMLFPSASGLSDYEISKGMMQQLPKEYGEQLLNNPHIRNVVQNSVKHSNPFWEKMRTEAPGIFKTYAPKGSADIDNPLIRNMTNAIANPREHGLVNFARKYIGEGQDTKHSTLLSGIAHAAVGSGHGLEGMAGSLLGGSPELAGNAAFQGNKTNILQKSKAKLLASGISAGSGESPKTNYMMSESLKGLFPTEYELYDAARSGQKGLGQIGNIANKIQTHAPNIAKPLFSSLNSYVNKPKELIQQHANEPWSSVINHDLWGTSKS